MPKRKIDSETLVSIQVLAEGAALHEAILALSAHTRGVDRRMELHPDFRNGESIPAPLNGSPYINQAAERICCHPDIVIAVSRALLRMAKKYRTRELDWHKTGHAACLPEKGGANAQA